MLHEISIEEIEAVRLSKSEWHVFLENFEPERHNFHACMLDFKEQLLRKRPQPKPPIPLHKQISYDYRNGIETIRYTHRKPARRRIHGVASTPTVTSHKVSRLSEGCRAFFPIPLLSAHSKRGGRIGEVVHVRTRVGEVYIQASIDDTAAGKFAWDMIERGELRCLSVGATNERIQAEVEGVTFVERWTLKEVSVCRRGANADARLEVIT
jgi:hypothetical protein